MNGDNAKRQGYIYLFYCLFIYKYFTYIYFLPVNLAIESLNPKIFEQ